MDVDVPVILSAPEEQRYIINDAIITLLGVNPESSCELLENLLVGKNVCTNSLASRVDVFLSAAWVFNTLSIMSPSLGPGHTALTVIPFSAVSTDTALVRPQSPAFVVMYAAALGIAFSPN